MKVHLTAYFTKPFYITDLEFECRKKGYQMAKCKWTRHVILAINPIFVRNSGFELHKTTKLFLEECNQLNLSNFCTSPWERKNCTTLTSYNQIPRNSYVIKLDNTVSQLEDLMKEQTILIQQWLNYSVQLLNPSTTIKRPSNTNVK